MAAAELQIRWVFFPRESCYESAKAIQSPHPALKINEQTDNSIAKPAHGNPLVECWECAKELSIQSYFENGAQQRIDDFIANWCTARISVARDGHCICSSWIQCLADHGELVEGGVVRLIDVLTTEIGNHHDHYKSYITGDWKQDLIDFKLNQKFDSTIVDLLLYTLANSTSTSCYVVDTVGANEDVQIKAAHPTRPSAVAGSSPAIPATGNAIAHGKRQFLFTSKSGDIGETSFQSSVQSPPCQMENSCGKVRSQETTAKHLTEREDKQQRQMKRIKYSVWDGVLVKNVHALPYDIDGNCIYQLPYSKNDRLASSRDGRPWRI
ncbi:unnamed protein product [Porites lobata]|uniref:Uncharacterized protein n=1 Tax=Porites lobata TaxID=104759 RepID=A0ABN8PFA5_9CNID|nr:unnamed protein product [Porites lobata]